MICLAVEEALATGLDGSTGVDGSAGLPAAYGFASTGLAADS
jgi:hypothetical protein